MPAAEKQTVWLFKDTFLFIGLLYLPVDANTSSQPGRRADLGRNFLWEFHIEDTFIFPVLTCKWFTVWLQQHHITVWRWGVCGHGYKLGTYECFADFLSWLKPIQALRILPANRQRYHLKSRAYLWLWSCLLKSIWRALLDVVGDWRKFFRALQVQIHFR